MFFWAVYGYVGDGGEGKGGAEVAGGCVGVWRWRGHWSGAGGR